MVLDEASERKEARQRARDAFSARFRRAMEQAPRTEFSVDGGWALLAREIGVRDEAVRKWRYGLSLPDQPKMRKIAMLLDVDYSWLAVGETAKSPTPTAAHSTSQAPAVSPLVAFVQSFVRLRQPGADIRDASLPAADFRLALAGKPQEVSVTSADEQDNGSYFVHVPKEYEKLLVLAVVPYGEFYGVLKMPPALVKQHATPFFGDFAVTLRANKDGRFHSKRDDWPWFDLADGKL